jgi:hypothetical protein
MAGSSNILDYSEIIHSKINKSERVELVGDHSKTILGKFLFYMQYAKKVRE